MSAAPFQEVTTRPFSDQKPGTSGLRKKTRVFMQPHYLENFVQSVFDTLREEDEIDFGRETLVIGGDGRYYNGVAIQRIVRMAAANGFGGIMIGRGGLLSTPAMSAVIRGSGVLGGLLLTASHNPGGAEADFGIKYNVRNGGPAPEGVTEQIYRHTLKISRYRTVDHADIDLDQIQGRLVGNMRVMIFDPLEEYTRLMAQLFDFERLHRLFHGGFRLLFDAMYGITGPYAQRIFEQHLGAPTGTVIRATPLEDFGGLHPDPSLLHAAELARRMMVEEAPDLGAACDGGWRQKSDSRSALFRAPRGLPGGYYRARPELHPGISQWSQRRCPLHAHQHRGGPGRGSFRDSLP